MLFPALFPCLLAIGVMVAAPAVAQPLTGEATVIDGDTLDVAGTRIRLIGVDAPEMAQDCRRADGAVWDCGQWSRAQVAQRLNGQRLTCMPEGQDRYGRILARCQTGGKDFAAGLVEDGIVFAFRRYDQTYVAAEKRAAFAGRGLWQGEAERPEAFRGAAAAAAAQTNAPAPAACAIKGNIGARGRLYHLPQSSSYGATRIDTAEGERWFCTAAEARAAGWSPACGDGTCR